MADNTGRDGHGWAIAGAFAAQAGIFIGIGTLLGGTVTAPAATSASAAPAPAFVSPLPSISPQGIQQAGGFSYMLSMDGQTGSGVFIGDQPAPSYTVTPGQDLTVTLGVTIPAALNITDLTMSLADTSQMPQDLTVYDDAAQPLAPGQYTFTLDWAGSASELQPGTKWSLYMSTTAADGSYGRIPVATITVGP